MDEAHRPWGFGHATAAGTAEAYERALKAAETDATKRALATFGNRFGLGLYDKDQNGVTPRRSSDPTMFSLIAPDGSLFADKLSPEGFAGAMRQPIEKVTVPSDLSSLMERNAKTLERLKVERPELKTAKGLHYADVLAEMVKGRLAKSSKESEPPLKPSKIAAGPRIDKSLLPIGEERRFRDKTHLVFVACHPCLICGRAPAHAHHLTFAQRRGLAIKVSDEFTVPLCAVHHDEVHRHSSEMSWWTEKGLDPVAVASELWTKSRSRHPSSLHVSADRETGVGQNTSSNGSA